MPTKSKKRTPYAGLNSPHIGQILSKYCTEKRIQKAAWARIQGIKPATVGDFLKKPSIQLGTLFTVCQVLKYNFINEIAAMLPAEYEPHPVNPLSNRVAELEKENEKLKNDISLLKEIVALK